jgi:hypothetical protein
MNIYQIGQGGYLGSVAQIEPDAGCPAGFTRTAPPEIPEGSFAVWAGTRWEITDVAYVPPVFVDVPTVPQQVTMRQARLALHSAGLLAGVDLAIAGMTEPAKTAAAIEWEYAQTVDRASGLVPAMATALGMTEAQIDDLFIAAAAL